MGARKRLFFMAKNQVSLKISGKVYYGWLSVSVKVAIESLARSFSLSLTPQSNQDSKEQIKVVPGDSVELFIGDDIVLTGFVTKISENYSGLTKQLTIEGSSKTIDLVECCIPDSGPYSYKKQKPIAILEAVAAHYGIDVVEGVKKEDLIDATFSPEGKIGDELTKLLRKSNLLLTDDEKGRLVLAAAGSAKSCDSDIKTGVNVLAASRVVDQKKLFKRYVLLGQGTNPTSERSSKDYQLKAFSEDSSVRSRVSTMVQTGNAIEAELQARVALIKEYSRATSESLAYTVQGWRQKSGKLWPVNAFVKVNDTNFGIKKEYLITGLEYSLSASGMTTKLELKSPNAYLYTEAPTAEKAVKNALLESIGPVEKAEWTGK